MNYEQIIARLREIRSALDGDLTNVDVDALRTEADSLLAQKTEIEERAMAARNLRQRIADGSTNGAVVDVMTAPESTNGIELRNTQAYMEAYARGILEGNFNECRALLSTNAPENGQVPVPQYVEDRIRTAWERETLMSRVTRTFLPGNYVVGFEISGGEAQIHLEGAAAISEENLTLGVVTLVPQTIKKWVSVSDEVYNLRGQALIDYVYDELAYRIARKAAQIAITAILAAPQTSSATAPAVASLTRALQADTIIMAEAELTSEALDVVAIMNRKTRAALKALQATSGDNVGDVFDGLDIVYTDHLKSYAAASAGEAYMIVGDPGDGLCANFPNGDEIKYIFDEITGAQADLIKITGKQYGSIGVVAPLRFCKVLKPNA